MGSGKSAVGRLLAEKMNLEFQDLDDVIISQENRGIPEIFKTSGEIYFRKKEAEVLKKLLGQGRNFVLSLGGGTPCYGNTLELLKQTPDVKTVYLKTSVQELTRRLLAEKDFRPVISHLPNQELLEDFIRKHLFERSFYYNQSDLIVATDAKKIAEITEEIIAKLG